MSVLRGLTPQERTRRETRRLAAAEMFEHNIEQAEVARRLDVTPQAVNKWHQAWKNGGPEALRSAGPPGARPCLDEQQIAAVRRELQRGACAHGWDEQRWTLARIRRVIEETTGVWWASLGSLSVFLRRLGWSWQAPATRAVEQDEQAITQWREQVWPQVKRPRPGSGPG